MMTCVYAIGWPMRQPDGFVKASSAREPGDAGGEEEAEAADEKREHEGDAQAMANCLGQTERAIRWRASSKRCFYHTFTAILTEPLAAEE